MLSKEELIHIARLAHLSLTEQDLVRFTSDLNHIFTLFEKLNSLDTSCIEPTSCIVHFEPFLREDETEPSQPKEEWQHIAPQMKGNFVIVPRVLNK